MTQQALYRRLRQCRDRITPPPGFAWPEISEGQLVMAVGPRPRHQYTAKLVSRQLDAQLPEGFFTFERTDTDDETLGKLRVPDLVVCSGEAMQTDDPLDPRDIVLAIEIVSPSNPENDYDHKTRDYPAMGIPHYLILDPRDGTWTYQWGIGRAGGRPAYENRLHRPYGEAVTIGTGGWALGRSTPPAFRGTARRRWGCRRRSPDRAGRLPAAGRHTLTGLEVSREFLQRRPRVGVGSVAQGVVQGRVRVRSESPGEPGAGQAVVVAALRVLDHPTGWVRPPVPAAGGG
jgi:hypothetical protein